MYKKDLTLNNQQWLIGCSCIPMMKIHNAFVYTNTYLSLDSHERLIMAACACVCVCVCVCERERERERKREKWRTAIIDTWWGRILELISTSQPGTNDHRGWRPRRRVLSTHCVLSQCAWISYIFNPHACLLVVNSLDLFPLYPCLS